MTHGPPTCIGMVDEALKRPPSQIGKNMPTRPSPAVEIDVSERLTVQASVFSTDQGGGKRR